MKLLVATKNRGKIAEFAELMHDLSVSWLGLDDVGITEDVEETGGTFRENAILKGVRYAQLSGLLTLADDSGLEVDALGGEPGVYTGRYGGEGLSAQQRYELLLQKLVGVPEAERTARFCCVIVVAAPNGRILAEVEGFCHGRITFAPVGTGGFGYDPVFFVPTQQQTLAQLSSAEKHKISHRGQAMTQLAPVLQQLLTDSSLEL